MAGSEYTSHPVARGSESLGAGHDVVAALSSRSFFGFCFFWLGDPGQREVLVGDVIVGGLETAEGGAGFLEGDGEFDCGLALVELNCFNTLMLGRRMKTP